MVKKKSSIQEKAYHRIERNIELAAERLEKEKLSTKTYIHRNRDGSIDAQLNVKVPRGITAREVLISVEKTTRQLLGTFISTGCRYETRPDEPDYERYMGLTQARSYWQKNTKHRTISKVTGKKIGNRIDNFATGKEIATRLKKAGRYKPKEVLMRIHWNKEGKWPMKTKRIMTMKERKRKGL